ncbi:MAG: restriction endonuclease subunit S [Lentimicrobiaceae bacterium]|nr:restriction endonuclease subunit S [Lentimicrobiaceae bacterium]
MNKVKLGEIAKTNRTTFCVDDFDEILYLDTSSVTNGIFDDFIHLSKNDKIPSRAKRAVKDKTIIYSTVRPNLQHFGIFDNPKENVVVSTGFATIDVIDNLANPKFLYYYLTQDKFTNYLHTIATNNVSSYPSINPSDLENLELEIPDIQTQTAIARVLSSLDDKIELNNKINKELENLAKTIYEYWFVQNADRNWERKKVATLIQNQKNGDWGKETKQGNYTEKVTCIRGTDINSLIGNNELKAPERYILEKNNNKFLTDGDFVIEISGGSPTQSTGRMAYILDEILKGFDTPLICSNFCKSVSLKDKNIFYYFMFVWKQLYDNGLFFGYEGKTSGIKNFLFDDFVSSYEISVPTTKILEKFNKTVSPLFSTIIKNKQESSNLAQLRDFLLPLLMNGQITISEEQNKPIIAPFKLFADDDTDFQTWKKIGLAARGNIDEKTLRNIYEAIDENDR